MSTEDQAGRAEPAAPMTPQGAARRRLAKAGLGAAGVLWTTQASATRVCVSASAALSSGLLSKKPNATAVSCAGRSPGYWKNHGGWPVATDTLFSRIFSCSEANDGTYGSATLLQLVEGCKFDKYNLGMHLVATYLNVKQGWTSYLSERTLLQMWAELQSTGHYQPAKGVYWDAETTKKYLASTQG
ncbi:hypothetical protein [Massilia varians]|uniref:hypothetical protein n=1 Tax=Massilia varians TaxID=457921 RepID=UPI002493A90F|nr:hypothetical protein [Massilia varians]